MPLQVLSHQNDLLIGLWQIKENEFQNTSSLSGAAAALSVHPRRRAQWMAARQALNTLLGQEVEVYQDENGKPWLKDQSGFISLSHSGDFAAVAFHPVQAVGIDLEELDERLIRLSQKFVRPEEESILQHLGDLNGSGLIWSAKESLFKWYGKGQVDFKKHLLIELKDHQLFGHIQKDDCMVQIAIHYHFFANYVITWTLPQH